MTVISQTVIDWLFLLFCCLLLLHAYWMRVVSTRSVGLARTTGPDRQEQRQLHSGNKEKQARRKNKGTENHPDRPRCVLSGVFAFLVNHPCRKSFLPIRGNLVRPGIKTPKIFFSISPEEIRRPLPPSLVSFERYFILFYIRCAYDRLILTVRQIDIQVATD